MENFTHTEHCDHIQKVREAQGYDHYGQRDEDCDCSCHSERVERHPIDSV